MSCEEFGPKITAYVDGELPDGERGALEAHLAACDTCRREADEQRALKEKLAMIEFKEPSDDELEKYWQSIYNRLERSVGWVLLSVGAILLLCYGGFELVEELIRDPSVALAVKVGVAALVFGVVVLFVSLLRERLTVCKVDRYSKEVKR